MLPTRPVRHLAIIVLAAGSLLACDRPPEGDEEVIRLPANTVQTLGTIGVTTNSTLTTIQAAPSPSNLGGWQFHIGHRLVPNGAGDFDGDGLDDFIITSEWGMGILKNDAANNLVPVAGAQWGTNIGAGWTLRAEDQVVLVGRFAPGSNITWMLIKGQTGLAFVRREGGALRAVSAHLWGQQGGWNIQPGDRILGKGRFTGDRDNIVIRSDQFFGILRHDGVTTLSTLVVHAEASITPSNRWTIGPRTWALDVFEPRFRFVGAADLDRSSNNRDELILVGREGLAILQVTGASLSDAAAYRAVFIRKDGEAFGTSPAVKATLEAIVAVADLNNSGGAELLYHTSSGLSAVGVSSSSSIPWSFTTVASVSYGTAIMHADGNAWVFDGADEILPFVGDFDGDGRKDISITSHGWLGALSVSGSGFRLVGIKDYGALPITTAERIAAVGTFDSRTSPRRARFLFKNDPDPLVPPHAAVLTYHNEPGRSGLNSREFSLNTQTVRAGLRHRAGSPMTLPGGGQITAQVLYAPGVRIKVNGVERVVDAAFALTSANFVHVIDVNNLSATLASTQVAPIVGDTMTSTPVIDYERQLMYFVFRKPDLNYYLAAWDILENGLYAKLPPVMIRGSYPTSSLGRVDFEPSTHRQRPGLLLSKNSIYVAFGASSPEETIKYHGWIFRYDARSFNLLGLYNTSPNEGPGSGAWANGSGIWGAGGGVVGDARGQIYVMTGNGPYNSSKGTVGNSFLKLGPRGYTLQLRKVWRPANAYKEGYQFDLWKTDWDLGGGSPFLMPGSDRLIGAGKEGKYHVLNRETFALANEFQGHFNLYDHDGIDDGSYLWAQPCRLTHNWLGTPHMHGSAVSWNNWVYHQSELDSLRAYRYSGGILDKNQRMEANDGRISPENDNNGTFMYQQLSVSSDGTVPSSAVVWATLQAREDGTSGCAESRRLVTHRLTAYDASNLQCLWSTPIAHVPRWTPPTVANGMVIVPNLGASLNVFIPGGTAGGCPTTPFPKPICGPRACPACGGVVGQALQQCCNQGTCNTGFFCDRAANTCRRCEGGVDVCCGSRVGERCCGGFCQGGLRCNLAAAGGPRCE